MSDKIVHTCIGFGTCSKENSFDAGMCAARESMKLLGKEHASFAMVFSPVKYDLKKMVEGAYSVLGNIPMIGCSTFGQVTSNGPVKDSVIVITFFSESARVAIGIGNSVGKNPRKAARDAISSAIKELGATDAGNFMITKSGDEFVMYSPYNVIMFPDGLNCDGDEIVEGIRDVIGERFPLIGGSACDDFNFKKTYQFYNGKVYTDSVVVALLNLNVKTGIGVAHGWKAIGKALLVTKSKKNTVFEIDGAPAIKVYEDCFGVKKAKLLRQPLAKFAITYPLGIASTEKEYRIRTPIVANEDGSIVFAAKIPEDSVVRIMDGEPKTAIAAAKDAAKQAWVNAGKPKKSEIVGAIMISDVARYKCLGDKSTKEIEAIEQVIGKIPIFGFYTYGEQAPASDFTAQFHNETVVIYLITNKSTAKTASVMRAVNYMYNIQESKE